MQRKRHDSQCAGTRNNDRGARSRQMYAPEVSKLQIKYGLHFKPHLRRRSLDVKDILKWLEGRSNDGEKKSEELDKTCLQEALRTNGVPCSGRIVGQIVARLHNGNACLLISRGTEDHEKVQERSTMV